MADKVVVLVQEMRGVKSRRSFVILNEVTDEVVAADAHKVTPGIEFTEKARLITTFFNVGVEIKLNGFFQPARHGLRTRSPVAVFGSYFRMPFVSITDVFVQLQPATGE